MSILLPAVFVLCLSTGLGVLYFMPEQWFRAAPPFIAACPLVFVHILVRRGHVQTGAALFLTVISIALITGMYLNGGVHAPAYSASLAVLAVIAWLYGFWAALLYTVAIVGLGGIFVALASFGMLYHSADFGPLLQWVLLASFHVGLLVATSVPHRILRDALASSEERRIEAEKAHAREKAALRELADGQAALRASEARYRDIFEKNRAAKLIIDPASGRIVQANSAACAFYGYTQEEITQRAIWDINILGEEETRKRMTAAVAGQQGHFHFVHRLASGELRDVMVYTGVIEAGGQRLLHSIILDVTDQVRAERELRLEQQRLAGALEGTRAATWEWDLQTGEMRFDERWAQIAGYTLAELQPIGVQTWLDLAHPEDFPEQANRLQRHVAGLDPNYDYECRMRHKDGHWVWVHDRGRVLEWAPDGTPLRMYGTHADITARKQGEAERERLLGAIEQSGESIFIAGNDGAIQFVNSAFERTTGYSKEEALGKTPRIMKSGLHDAAFYGALWAKLLSGETWQGEIINRHQSGALYTSLATISPVTGSQEEVVGFVAAMRDITGQRALEDQYRHAQKMEAIGQLTGGVAHDFNNLLQVINGYTEIAQMRLESGHPVHEVLAEVAKAGSRASDLVGQLLAFSRRQIMRPIPLNLNDVVAGLLKMLGRLIGEHIQLHFDPRPRGGYLHADRGMLEQIIVNLCVNARDAMAQGGHLLLETDEVTFDEPFCTRNSWASPGRYVHLRVADSGCGMTPQALERIFEPFYTTKGVGRGTGLGLPMVYGIVKQHEGLIHVESTPGQGTVFHVYLPASEEAEEQLEREERECAGGGHETLLLAEDDAAVCQLAREILEDAGYTVLIAENGVQACDVFLAHQKRIALAILDVVMPEMGGRDACERMRENRHDFPVLFTTGYSETEIHTNFVLDKGLTLLKKPYNRDALLRAVRETLNPTEQRHS